MEIAKLISHFSNLIWLFIPLRQKGTDYFFYFVIYAVSAAILLIDTILLLHTIYSIHPANIYLGQGFFLIILLYDFKKIPNYIFFLLGILALSICLPFLIPVNIILPLLIIEHTVILFIILKKTIQYAAKHEKLNLFHFIILLFEISVIIRFCVIIENIKIGIIFFYLTTAFGIFIAVYFLFFNEKNSFKISLSTGIKD